MSNGTNKAEPWRSRHHLHDDASWGEDLDMLWMSEPSLSADDYVLLAAPRASVGTHVRALVEQFGRTLTRWGAALAAWWREE